MRDAIRRVPHDQRASLRPASFVSVLANSNNILIKDLFAKTDLIQKRDDKYIRVLERNFLLRNINEQLNKEIEDLKRVTSDDHRSLQKYSE